MVEKSGMCWLCNDLELLKMREGHHPASGSITGARDRITEVDVADMWEPTRKSRVVESKGTCPWGHHTEQMS